MVVFPPPAVLAIDAGSGSCQTLLFDAEGTLLETQREWTYLPVPGAPSGFDIDTVDGWGQVTPCIQDVPARMVVPAAAMIADELAQAQYRCGGDRTSITAPARLRRIQRHQPEIWALAVWLTILGDWVVARLSGGYFTDPSLGSSSKLFDLRKRAWSDQSAAEMLAPLAVLPPVRESDTIVGEIASGAAAQTGLCAGTARMTEAIGFPHVPAGGWVRDALLRAANPGIAGDERYDLPDTLAAAGPPGVAAIASNVKDGKQRRHAMPSPIDLGILQLERTGLAAADAHLVLIG